MAKFRRNHNTSRTSRGGLGLSKFVLFGVLTIILLMFLLKSLRNADLSNLFAVQQTPVESVISKERFYLPSSKGELVHHKYYSLSYVEEWEQAEWVAYELSVDMLNGPRVPRAKKFKHDPKVSSHSANEREYSRSGYTRGHLVPAADMGFNELAMKETFYTSNISPQKSKCNGGIWRELEENVRDWARKYKSVYIVSGPILTQRTHHKLERSKISVPQSFFKIILTAKGPKSKAIAYIIPNKGSVEGLEKYAVTIDQVEQTTGLDFFADLLDESLEEEIESKIDVTLWPLDAYRYNKRITQWNKR